MSQGLQSCSQKQDHNEQQKLQDIEIKDHLNRIKNKILVMSGKGGVGKSSIAAFLAVALAKRSYSVGLMDIDLHGPSIPGMLGIRDGILKPTVSGKVIPVEAMPNLHVISIETLLGDNKDAATIWRGPIKIGVIRQFISDMEWSDLDYLIIDSPPGTGDEPLTIAQTIPDAKALIVTTPQEVALADVRKSINFCRQVKMDIIGLVENMSGFRCPHCNKEIDLFHRDGGLITSKKENVRFLASLPIEVDVVSRGDSGKIMVEQDDRLFFKELNKLTEKIITFSKSDDLPDKEKQGAEKPVKARDEKQKLIAIPTSDGKLCSHFGHCEQFIFIETRDGKIEGKSIKTPPAHEPGILPAWLYKEGADVIIAGGIGEKAKQLLDENGIKVITGAPMDSPESLVNQYLTDSLVTGENACDH